MFLLAGTIACDLREQDEPRELITTRPDAEVPTRPEEMPPSARPDAGALDRTTCLDRLPAAWPELSPERIDETSLGDENGEQDSARFSCTLTQKDVLQHHESILGLGDAYADLKPGIILQGDAFRHGLLSTVPLPRAEATLSTDLPITNPTRTIATPNSATLQAAVSDIQREADQHFVSGEVGPAMLESSVELVSSYEESLLALGASAEFSAGLYSAGFETEFTDQRSRFTMTVAAKLIQPLYTISFADDVHATPRSFFSSQLTNDDFEAQCSLGTLTPENPPVFVKSVTYGRVVVFLFSTEEKMSTQDFKLLVQGSILNFEGSAEVRARYQELAARSSIRVFALGGSQDLALEAIRTGDYATFFAPLLPSTAKPLSYSVRYLGGARSAATIASALQYVSVDCRYDDCLGSTLLDTWDVTVHQSNGGNHSPVATGIDLQPNDRLTIAAGGSIWPGFIFGPCNGPEGSGGADSNYPAPAAPGFSLIGRVAASGWMYIGRHYNNPAVPWTGTLELGTNDNDPISGNDCDGSGFTARIERERPTCTWTPR